MKKVLLAFLLLIPTLLLADNIKVLVIDTGIQGENPELKPFIKEELNDNYKDEHGHGTHVAGLVTKDVCKQVELISCKAFERLVFNENLFLNCLKIAIDKKVNFVNFSGGGLGPLAGEYYLFRQLSANGTKIIVSTGNFGQNMKRDCIFFPACYTIANLIPVGALNKEGKRWRMSNYGIKMVWEEGEKVISLGINKLGFKVEMSGTSMATAIHTNRLLKKKCLELNK